VIGSHRLTPEDLDALAADADDASVVRSLRRSQYSRRALLLRAVLDRAAEAWPRAYRGARVEEAFDLLARVQEGTPPVVEDGLLHPHVGAWGAATLRRMSDPGADLHAVVGDLRHLGAIAASAAVRAGTDFDVTVPLRDGQVVLPGLGSAELPGIAGASAMVRGHRGATTITCGSTTVRLPEDPRRDGTAWRALPELTAAAGGTRLTVALDDVDPYRRYPGMRVAVHLPRPEVDRWRARFAEAWGILAMRHPRLARSIAACLESIVPLAPMDATGVSGTSSDAFGAAALNLPETGTELAVALVHEHQHSKLGALLDLVPLSGARADRLFYAPWRDDPRPVRGLLHGSYAYFAITDFWRVQRQTEGDGAALAHFEFARWREQTWRTTSALSGAGALNAAGQRFVEGMRGVLARWRSEPVPRGACEAARIAALDHRIAWRLRNLRPDEGTVRRLAEAWRSCRPCLAAGPVPCDVVPGPATQLDGARLRLLRRSLGAPRPAATATADLADASEHAGEVTLGDLCLVRGDHRSAVERFRAEIVADPATVVAWSGLAVATAARTGTGGLRALQRCPEVVLAVHRQVVATSGVAPDPVVLADWLDPAAG
jgi:HEXXH motif-containing protein